ncbi:hypothetical protein [Streptacidiphilus rugosus]|uniref:hypothetical protein n=1 Tax=Streptacidiphilus rugosus TaxID=405783 RepID=UPI00056956B3|nr:hypothetical protein [Streptacidiphilus rugosus]
MIRTITVRRRPVRVAVLTALLLALPLICAAGQGGAPATHRAAVGAVAGTVAVPGVTVTLDGDLNWDGAGPIAHLV